MKYILRPILAISIVIFVTFIIAPIKFIWHLIWDFEIISFQHATPCTDWEGDRIPLYDRPFKEFMKEIFIYQE